MPKVLIARDQARKILLGSWQGVQEQDDNPQYQWITHHYNDGTYASVFRQKNTQGDYQDTVAAGYWGISGMTRFTLFRGWEQNGQFIPALPTNPNYYDSFLMQQLEEDLILYCNLETGVQYRAVRVEQGAEFPPLPTEQ